MAYELPKLTYAYDALAPHIDAKTMEIHHTKHHNAYITNANNALKDQPALAALEVNALIADLGKVPEAIRGALRNNAGGHSNHSFFWTIMGPGKGGAPKGALAAAIDSQLGGLAKFKDPPRQLGRRRNQFRRRGPLTGSRVPRLSRRMTDWRWRSERPTPSRARKRGFFVLR